MTSFKINFCISGLPETWITPTRRDFLCFFGVVLLCITQIPHPPQLFSWMLPNNFAAKLQKCFTDYEASPSCPSAASRRLQFFISGLNIFFQHQRPWSELHRLLSRFQTEEKKKKTSQKDLLNVFHRPDMAALSSYQCASLMYIKKLDLQDQHAARQVQ